ncbi:hypothetical protein Tco_1523710, partial [Tanacetum coccineum]
MADEKAKEKGMCEHSSSEKRTEYDAYFEMVQSRKKLSPSLQEKLTAAFTRIPVSSFPQVPRGKDLAAAAITATSATAAGIGAGAASTLGAIALGATGPVAAAGLTVA